MAEKAKTNGRSQPLFYLSLYLLVAGVYLLSASGRIGLSDNVAMLNVTQSITNEGSFSAEPCAAELSEISAGMSIGCVPGTDGRHYAGYGLVPSLMAVPVVFLARFVSGILHANVSVISKAGVSLFTALVAPIACLVLAGWILKIGYKRSTAAIGACILAFASPFWLYSVGGFFSEPYFTLAVLTTACLLADPRSRFACLFAGFAFGLACGTRLNGVILLPAFVFYMAFHVWVRKLSLAQFVRDLVEFSVPFSACIFLIALANYSRFGSPFKTGYHLAFPSSSMLLSTPLADGLFGVLLNGEVGLLVFAPWVLIALICFPRFVRAHISESVLCGTASLIYVLFFAKFSQWHGGWVVGPRLLVPVIPFLVLMIIPAIQSLQHFAGQEKKTWMATCSLVIVSVIIGTGFMIQLAITAYPVERYYALTEFYKDKPIKPWWSGSTIFASVDFLSRVNTATTSQRVEFNHLEARNKSHHAYSSAHSAATEEAYLRRFPNPANALLPNLILFKFGVMGIPVTFAFVYLMASIPIVAIGAVGLRKYTRNPD